MDKKKKTKKQIISWLNNKTRFNYYQIIDGDIYEWCEWAKICGTTDDFWKKVEWKEVIVSYNRTREGYRGRSKARKFYANWRTRRDRRKTKFLLKECRFDEIPSENYKVYGERIAWDID